MGIIVRNQGQIIISTNYYETELCKKGIVHCSVNDKCFRILLPPRIGEFGKNGENVENAERSVKAVREMRCAKRVLIGIDETDNGRLFCFTFDDETDLPYRLFLSEVQVSPNISAESIFETDGLSVRIYAWNDTRDIFFEAAHFDAFHALARRPPPLPRAQRGRDLLLRPHAPMGVLEGQFPPGADRAGPRAHSGNGGAAAHCAPRGHLRVSGPRVDQDPRFRPLRPGGLPGAHGEGDTGAVDRRPVIFKRRQRRRRRLCKGL